MSDDKKKRPPRYTTPIGIAVFPRLKEPDFKFKKEHGEYSVKLRLPEADALKIIAQAEAVAEQAYRDEVAVNRIDKKTGKPVEIKNAGVSYEREFDETTKEPKGTIVIPFKMNGGYTDKKTNEKIKKRCPVFDSLNQDITGKVDVWGGSEIRVSYTITPYFAEADKKAGASIRLEAVQVIKLVTKGTGDASMYGFGKEDGFAASEQETETTPMETPNAPAKAARDF